jgi:hypothetical protein
MIVNIIGVGYLYFLVLRKKKSKIEYMDSLYVERTTLTALETDMGSVSEEVNTDERPLSTRSAGTKPRHTKSAALNISSISRPFSRRLDKIEEVIEVLAEELEILPASEHPGK